MKVIQQLFFLILFYSIYDPLVFTFSGKNPHLGHLAWANAFVITADSISMLSEACSTGYVKWVITIDNLMSSQETKCDLILKSSTFSLFLNSDLSVFYLTGCIFLYLVYSRSSCFSPSLGNLFT